MSTEIKITIKQTNAEKNEVEISIQSDLTVLELKLKVKEAINIPENRQNLIFKGRILQDNKKLDDYKISNGDKILLVKKMVEENPSSAPNPNVPHVNAQSGVGAPGQINLDLLNQPMGMNMNIDQLTQLMQNPEISAQLNTMLQDPTVINAMLNHPQIKPLLDANPMLRQQLSDPNFIRSMLSPENLRMMSQMQQMMGGMGMNPMMGGMGMNPMMNPFMNPQMMNMFSGMNNPNAGANTGANAGANPSANTSSTGNASNSTNPSNTNSTNPPNSNFSAPNPGANPMNPMMNPFMNPYMMNPYMFNPYMAQGMNFPGSQPAASSTNLTDDQVKEKYKDQLQQLKDMGFDNEEKNIKALRLSNGNVEAAVDKLLSGTL